MAEALQVTAAHEFFHAVQAAYDFSEDAVLMEGTATWIEDEVYDDVDDNRQYLERSQLTRPDVPFDLALRDPANSLAGFQYGAWIFFRYLSEVAAGPELVRRIWEHADATAGAPDRFSLAAVDTSLRERGTTFGRAFADWAAVNVAPDRIYEEGAFYPAPPLDRRTRLRARGSASSRVELDHLTSWYGAFEPGAGVGPKARLRIVLDLPPRLRGSRATAVVVDRVGSVRPRAVELDAKGDATLTVPFGRPGVARVVLVLTNASARYRCWRGTVLACQGLPLDGVNFGYAVRVL